MKESMTMWWWYIRRLLMWNSWVKVNEMTVLRHQRDLKQDWNEKSNIVVPAVSWQILHHFLLLLRPLLSLFFTVVKWKAKPSDPSCLFCRGPCFCLLLPFHTCRTNNREHKKKCTLYQIDPTNPSLWLMVMESNLSLTPTYLLLL